VINRKLKEAPYRITPLTPEGVSIDGPSEVGEGIAYVNMHPIMKAPHPGLPEERESIIHIAHQEFWLYSGVLWAGQADEYDPDIHEIEYDHFGFEVWPPVEDDIPDYLVFFHVEKVRHYTEWGHSYVRYITHPRAKGDHVGAHFMLRGAGWETT
jgi:hypothetical protein